jgi:hypothetical protein
MEKKGDLLNQLAIISDLIEKLNLIQDSSTVLLEIPESEYDKVYEYICKKQNKKVSSPGKTFTIKMGEVDIVFNKNSDGKVRSS